MQALIRQAIFGAWRRIANLSSECFGRSGPADPSAAGWRNRFSGFHTPPGLKRADRYEFDGSGLRSAHFL